MTPLTIFQVLRISSSEWARSLMEGQTTQDVTGDDEGCLEAREPLELSPGWGQRLCRVGVALFVDALAHIRDGAAAHAPTASEAAAHRVGLRRHWGVVVIRRDCWDIGHSLRK
jgi:hypothetical protein